MLKYIHCPLCGDVVRYDLSLIVTRNWVQQLAKTELLMEDEETVCVECIRMLLCHDIKGHVEALTQPKDPRTHTFSQIPSL